MERKHTRTKRWSWVILLLALIAVNILASFIHVRVDLTEEKRYSLTRTTKSLVNNLEEPVQISVFLKGDVPAQFRKLANRTSEFLSILKETNPSKVQYRFIDPAEEMGDGKSWQDTLQGLGARPINLTVQNKSGQENKLAFPFALVTYKGESEVVNLLEHVKRDISVAELNTAEAMMEYQFDRSIERLNNPRKPFIAYATGNGEPSGPETFSLQQTIDPESVQQYTQSKDKSNYKLFLFNLKSQPVIPDTMKALIIVKPSEPFSDAEKLKIDQYIMRGGKVLWFLDNLFAEQDSLSFKSQLIAYERNLGLEDLLFRYGVRLNTDLLMDLQCDFLPFAVGGDQNKAQYEFLHWNYFPLFESRNNHIINKNIGYVASRFVNSIDTVAATGISKTFLLQSSANARTISTPALISANENRNAPEDALFRQKDIPAGVLLEGKFTSLYKNRIGRAQMDSLAPMGGFREANAANNKMIVVADGDIVLNYVSTKEGPLPMGLNLYTAGSQYEYQFANREFLLNCLEYLVNESSIIETRNKEVVLRLLDTQKVEAQKGLWQLINIALPIALTVLFGFIYQAVRRRSYAKPVPSKKD